MPIKSKGTNGKHPSLALGYRIRTRPLQEEFHAELVKARLRLHPLIQLEPYFQLSFAHWFDDLPYLEHIHHYLESRPLPTNHAPAPERSFELVGNEKWITDLGGKELLERIGLWDKLRIIPVSDPLMFAINPSRLYAPVQDHFIVENKTTYQALLPVLPESAMSTLIYGVGNKIVKSIENFHYQYPVKATAHRIHYFGDIDHAGVQIWHRLNNKCQAKPALPFYELALSKTPPVGKNNQLHAKEALEAFSAYFPRDLQNLMATALADGQYYPQEILTTEELQTCWRDMRWISMN